MAETQPTIEQSSAVDSRFNWLRNGMALGAAAISLLAASPERIDAAESRAASQTTSTQNGYLEVVTSEGRRPIFPSFVWALHPHQVESALQLGIRDFGASYEQVADAVGNRGRVWPITGHDTSVTPSSNKAGEFRWDEPDNYGVLEEQMPDAAPGIVTIQTITGKFFSRHSPAMVPKSEYEDYIREADVILFDDYLHNRYWWNANLPEHLSCEQQRELVALTEKINPPLGKPTGQWIETARIDTASNPVPPSPEQVRAQAHGAVICGAEAIGWWTHTFLTGEDFQFDIPANVAPVIKEVNGQFEQMTPILVSPEVKIPQTDPNQPIKTGIREFNGKYFLGIVNLSDKPGVLNRALPGLNGQNLEAFNGSSTIRAQGNRLAMNMKPYQVNWFAYTPQAAPKPKPKPNWNLIVR